MKQWAGVVVVLLATAALGGGAASETRASGEDDLAVVKKAVTSPAPGTRPRVAARATAPAARSGREPQWFKVRVVDRSTGHKKVTINLPLSLVRALGDETIDWGCHRDRDRRDGYREYRNDDHDRCHKVRIADVLRSLESGQDLVEVEDDESTVKVWVE